jgi:transketolase
MEGVSHEAASLAGHLGLGNLNFIYDDNHITIEGNTSLAFSEDVQRRFEAYGWHVLRANPYDHAELERALNLCIAETERPSLIICRSHIGYGAPHKQDSREAHGEPLGATELAGAKKALAWPESPSFLVPPEVPAALAARAKEIRRDYDAWQAGFRAWRTAEPQRASVWDGMAARKLPDDLLDQLCKIAPTTPAATRAHGSVVEQKAAELVPGLVGGSADLEPSTKTAIKGSPSVERGHFEGRNLHFGIREHGMGAIVNGMAVSGFTPFASSFLTFTDYARPAIRLSALMRQPVIWVFTHDSIFLGEDGPTHQPVEHLAALRAIPNLLVIRPADGLETAGAWAMALERRDAPTLIALTRQTTPALTRPASFTNADMRRGGYVLLENTASDAVSLIATGSEVGLALDAAQKLAAANVPARVVSMMAPQTYRAQDAAWHARVLPPGGRRVSIEAGVTLGWQRIVGEKGLCIGIEQFGESSPAADLAKHFGFTGDAVAARVQAWLKAGA